MSIRTALIVILLAVCILAAADWFYDRVVVPPPRSQVVSSSLATPELVPVPATQASRPNPQQRFTRTDARNLTSSASLVGSRFFRAQPPTPPPTTLPAVSTTDPTTPEPSETDASDTPPTPEEIAEAALTAINLVGSDAEAEAFWAAAVSAEELPTEARVTLITGLLTQGLHDPVNPTPRDLPLILRRLQIIEQLAPHSLDDASLAAFQSTYETLATTYLRHAPPP